MDAARRVGCKLVNWTEPEYPQSLPQIYDPPVVLDVRGDASIPNGPRLAIVGTRISDADGRPHGARPGISGNCHRKRFGPRGLRAALVQIEAVEFELRNLLVAARLNPTEKKIYELLSADESRPIDSLVEASGLNSSEVLATLFTLASKGIVRQPPGKQFNKVLL